MQQLDFQGTKLKDFKASRMKDRNFYDVSTFQGWIFKETQGVFVYYGWKFPVDVRIPGTDVGTYSIWGTLGRSDQVTGPGYVKYLRLKLTVVQELIPGGGFGGEDWPASSMSTTYTMDRITGEVTYGAEIFLPDREAFVGWPGAVSEINEVFGETEYTSVQLENLTGRQIRTVTITLSDPWPIESAASEAIKLMNATPDIRTMEWGAQAVARYRGQMFLQPGEPSYGLPFEAIIVNQRTAQQVGDGDRIVAGGGVATYIFDDVVGGGQTIYASRAMVKADSPVCVTYEFQEENRVRFAKPVIPFSGPRNRKTEVFIESACLAIEEFLPQYVARKAGAETYFRSQDPPTPSTNRNAPAVCYLPAP